MCSTLHKGLSLYTSIVILLEDTHAGEHAHRDGIDVKQKSNDDHDDNNNDNNLCRYVASRPITHARASFFRTTVVAV